VLLCIHGQYHACHQPCVFFFFLAYCLVFIEPIILVSAHPGDPQARVQFGQCLEVLTEMRFVWPSAERALDLLKGAKMNLTSPVLAESTTRREGKRKSSFEDVTLHPVGDGGFNGSGEYVQSNMGVSHIQRPSSQREVTPLPRMIQPPPLQSSSFAQTYAIQPPDLVAANSYVWEDGSSCGGSLNVSPIMGAGEHQLCKDEGGEFSGPLSTSVLPQIYSTGFGSPSVGEFARCDHLSSSSSSSSSQGVQHQCLDHHHHPQIPSSQMQYYSKIGPQLQMQGQSQYWSDYSALSQLGSTTVDGCGGYHHHQQQQQQQYQQQQPRQHSMGGMYYDCEPEPTETYGGCCVAEQLKFLGN